MKEEKVNCLGRSQCRVDFLQRKKFSKKKGRRISPALNLYLPQGRIRFAGLIALGGFMPS